VATPPRKNPPPSLAAYGGIGSEFALTVAILAGGGYAMDQWLDLLPWFTLAGMTLGLTAGFYRLIKLTNRMQQPPRGPR
jgi:F0F1-type ATP synthase assembly protein I